MGLGNDFAADEAAKAAIDGLFGMGAAKGTAAALAATLGAGLATAAALAVPVAVAAGVVYLAGGFDGKPETE